MSIEENIFKRAVFDIAKLESYGFIKKGSIYSYSREFLNGDFRAEIMVSAAGVLTGEVYDVVGDDVYFPLRVDDMAVGYVGEVRAAYEAVLTDIRDKCCRLNYFAAAQTNRICAALFSQYGDTPDFPWEKYPDCGVFRNPDNAKWYALIMTIDRSKLDAKQSGEVEIINLKLNEEKIPDLVKRTGFYPAYHMNKKSWLTVTLDDTLSDEQILELLNESHAFTLGKSSAKRCAKCEWLIPANPKFFDVEAAFKKSDEITWKQSNNIKAGDIIYMYLAAPVSAVIYKCEVTAVDIPYQYTDKNLSIKKVMKIKKLKQYEPEFMPFERLKKYGVNAVRGPRNMPLELSKTMK